MAAATAMKSLSWLFACACCAAGAFTSKGGHTAPSFIGAVVPYRLLARRFFSNATHSGTDSRSLLSASAASK